MMKMDYQPVLLATWSFGVGACRAGWGALVGGGDGAVLDAVEGACCAVEDDEAVDSVGYGGLPDASGMVTLDGAIMVSPSACGAVAAVQKCGHPVSLARRVMERTNHVMLAGTEADRFACDVGLQHDGSLLSESARVVYEKWKAGDPGLHEDARMRGWLPPPNVEEIRGIESADDDNPVVNNPEKLLHNRFHDTVGVLALGNRGNMACACSTSGMAFKKPGRVGDSPIIGHGLYCEQGVGCAVATGTGELIMGVCGSFLAVERLRCGDSPQQSAKSVIMRIIEEYDLESRDQVAVLVMNKQGEWSAAALRPGYRTAVMDESRTEPELIDAAWTAYPDDEKLANHSML